MNTVDYFLAAAKDLHDRLFEAVKGLSNEQLHFRPLGKGNQIFLLSGTVYARRIRLSILCCKKRRRYGMPKGGIRNSGWTRGRRERV
jgi:hypothetical protein